MFKIGARAWYSSLINKHYFEWMHFSGGTECGLEEQKGLVETLELVSQSCRTKTRLPCEFKKWAVVIIARLTSPKDRPRAWGRAQWHMFEMCFRIILKIILSGGSQSFLCMTFTFSYDSKHLEGFKRHRVADPYPESFWFSASKAGPESLHVEQVHWWRWWCWSGDITVRTLLLSNVFISERW